ncbi:hypothetical protein KCU67_g3552, partial [Aureobasidium melanogenum]
KGKAVEEAPEVITRWVPPLPHYNGENIGWFEKAKRAYPESRVRLCPTVSEFGKDSKTLAGYCNLATTGQLRNYCHASQDWVINAIKPYLQSINAFKTKLNFYKGPILNMFHQRANKIPDHTPVTPVEPTGDEKTDSDALQYLTVCTLKYMLDHSPAGMFWMSQENCPFELKENDWRSFRYLSEDVWRGVELLKFAIAQQKVRQQARVGTSRAHDLASQYPIYGKPQLGQVPGCISQAVTNIPVGDEKIVADSGLDRDQIVQLAHEDLGIALEKAGADSKNTLDDRKAANARSRKLQSSVRILRTQNRLAGSSAPSSQPSPTPKAKARRTLQRAKHQQQTKPLSNQYVDEDDDMDDVDTADLDNVATKYEDHESMDDLDDLDEWQDDRSGGYR